MRRLVAMRTAMTGLGDPSTGGRRRPAVSLVFVRAGRPRSRTIGYDTTSQASCGDAGSRIRRLDLRGNGRVGCGCERDGEAQDGDHRLLLEEDRGHAVGRSDGALQARRAPRLLESRRSRRSRRTHGPPGSAGRARGPGCAGCARCARCQGPGSRREPRGRPDSPVVRGRSAPRVLRGHPAHKGLRELSARQGHQALTVRRVPPAPPGLQARSAHKVQTVPLDRQGPLVP